MTFNNIIFIKRLSYYFTCNYNEIIILGKKMFKYATNNLSN